MSINLRLLTAAVEARLRTIPTATVYVSEAKDVPLLPDSDGAAAPYLVLHPSPGNPQIEVDLGDTVVELDWGFQVTCAAGRIPDLMQLVTTTWNALFRWAPEIDGAICGPCRPPLGFNPGPAQLDRSVAPHRPFLPLQFVSQITES